MVYPIRYDLEKMLLEIQEDEGIAAPREDNRASQDDITRMLREKRLKKTTPASLPTDQRQ